MFYRNNYKQPIIKQDSNIVPKFIVSDKSDKKQEPLPNNKQINVLIHVHYQPESIKRCIDSILEQTYENYHVICCFDDKRCLPILKQYKQDVEYFMIDVQSNHINKCNLYYNYLMDSIKQGCILFMDMYDKFLTHDVLKKIDETFINKNNILLWNHNKFKHCVCFHSEFKHLLRYDLQEKQHTFNQFINNDVFHQIKLNDIHFETTDKLPDIDYSFKEYIKHTKIKQIYVSMSLDHLKNRILKTFNLREYDTIDEPCVFFGIYDQNDKRTIENHNGDTYVMFLGIDVENISNINGDNYISISKDIQKRLQEQEIYSRLIYFNIVDKLFSNINTIYVGSHTHLECNSGYTQRSKHILNYLNNSLLLLNPLLKNNKKYINNHITIKDDFLIIFFSKEKIKELLIKYNIKYIICASDGNNFVSFSNYFNDIIVNKNIKTIYEVRGIWYKSRDANCIYNGYKINEKNNKYLELLELNALNKCNKMVFITDQVKNYFFNLNNNLKNKENIIIYNCAGITNTMYNLEKNKNKNKNEFFIVGYAGSISPYEGIDDLINVVESIYLINKNIRLRLIGKINNDRINLNKDFINYSSWMNKEDLNNEILNWDLYCITRKNYEVCNLVSPLKPYDPLSKKIPLLMSDCDCLKDISDNGKRCMLFKKDNLLDLKEKILHVMSNGYPSKLLDNGYNFIKNERNWKCEIEKYNKFLYS